MSDSATATSSTTPAKAKTKKNRLSGSFFRFVLTRFLLIIPTVFILVTIVFFVMRYTMFGRGIFALGGDESSAVRAGFKVRRIKFWLYVIVGVIAALAVTTDPKEQARLLGEGAGVLWGDVPTLPLYRQQRTLLVTNDLTLVRANPTRWGAGWNMDRWGSK